MSFISWCNEIKLYKHWKRFHQPLPESRLDDIIQESNGDYHARKVFAKPLFHALELFHIHDQEGTFLLCFPKCDDNYFAAQTDKGEFFAVGGLQYKIRHFVPDTNVSRRVGRHCQGP